MPEFEIIRDPLLVLGAFFVVLILYYRPLKEILKSAASGENRAAGQQGIKADQRLEHMENHLEEMLRVQRSILQLLNRIDARKG